MSCDTITSPTETDSTEDVCTSNIHYVYVKCFKRKIVHVFFTWLIFYSRMERLSQLSQTMRRSNLGRHFGVQPHDLPDVEIIAVSKHLSRLFFALAFFGCMLHLLVKNFTCLQDNRGCVYFLVKNFACLQDQGVCVYFLVKNFTWLQEKRGNPVTKAQPTTTTFRPEKFFRNVHAKPAKEQPPVVPQVMTRGKIDLSRSVLSKSEMKALVHMIALEALTQIATEDRQQKNFDSDSYIQYLAKEAEENLNNIKLKQLSTKHILSTCR